MKSRVHVSMKDFLRVSIVERSKYPTQDEAAKELGLTVSSFKQRYIREKKHYPEVFNGVPNYPTNTGNKRASLSEVQAMLESLRGAENGN